MPHDIRPADGVVVPGTVLLAPGPPEDVQVSVKGCRSAGPAIPLAPPLSKPLQDVEVSSRGSRFTRSCVPAATVCAGPLEQVQAAGEGSGVAGLKAAPASLLFCALEEAHATLARDGLGDRFSVSERRGNR